MATAKTASKNNPTQRKKAEQRMYKDKPVKPVLYVNRDERDKYMSAQYEDGNLVEDENGDPIKWEAVS
ncbi:hypothetical protein [Wolbachia endosymbiont of Folsomia candida]|uniref:hypothetical protein n=1 Tax=Wolbachia endosymbiont of Folsomia candida TaxID=169402 RepID=UPI000A75E223|nr:hypothetical protein [Wolbachia endosymbiont of Folsomia candida]APR98372.1 hypothetical protein ASM33_03720 [Wolbachia endosymbiont of Folsomia candida]